MTKPTEINGEEIYGMLWSIVRWLKNGRVENSIETYYDDKIAIIKENSVKAYIRGIGDEHLVNDNLNDLKCVFIYVPNLQTPLQKYNPGSWVNYVKNLYDEKVIPLRDAEKEQKRQKKIKEKNEKWGKVDDSSVFL